MPNRSLYCPACHRHTHLKSLTASRSIPTDNGREVYISECNNCARIFFITKKSNGATLEILPQDLPKPIDENTPDFLKSDLKEAYDCFSVNAYRSTGAMARRSLELCCNQKKAKGDNLKGKIKWLLENNIITKDLKDWADEVRLTGNDALHEKAEISKNDAEEILSLLENFIDILFIKPALIKKRKNKREGEAQG